MNKDLFYPFNHSWPGQNLKFEIEKVWISAEFLTSDKYVYLKAKHDNEVRAFYFVSLFKVLKC